MTQTLCGCGCGQSPRPGNAFVHGHNSRKHPPQEAAPCACGCGDYASPGKTYIKGHDKRKPKLPPQPCACGCGGMTTGRSQKGKPGTPVEYISGHNSRTAHPFQGKHHSEEIKMVISERAIRQMAEQFPDRIRNQDKFTGAHNSWHWMMSRCFDSWNASYPRYGGRGITVCERWLNFNNFLEDMGERPDGMSIDRIDGDGNYEPGNCRWATKDEQSANRRDPGGWETKRRNAAG